MVPAPEGSVKPLSTFILHIEGVMARQSVSSLKQRRAAHQLLYLMHRGESGLRQHSSDADVCSGPPAAFLSGNRVESFAVTESTEMPESTLDAVKAAILRPESSGLVKIHTR